MTTTMQENQILQALQADIPFVSRPFQSLGTQLGMTEDALIQAVISLKENKLIRRISPIYDTKMLGYDSALVAFQVPASHLESAAEWVGRHPGVSHNYERDDSFNLWFTLAVPPDSLLGLEKTVACLAEKTTCVNRAILRSKQVFKIGVRLDMMGDGDGKETSSHQEGTYTPLTTQEKNIICLTQNDIPLIARPFATVASQLEMDEDVLLQKLEEFKDRKIIRRFAAILFHRRVGFSANGMSAWKVPSDRIEEVGQKLAAFRAVSHCYERTTSPAWPYNLFAMIHAKSQQEVTDIVDSISLETGLTDYRILYSLREFKKKRIPYFTQDFYRWEEAVTGSKEDV